MEKKTIFAIILMFILTVSTIFLASSFIEANTPEKYSYTKAICTDSNFCQDYEVSCKNTEILSITPIEGAFAQFSEDWQDPRSQETIASFCG